MATNPGQGKRPDPADTYGGYGGYKPSNPADDPYGAYGQQQSTQQSQSGSDYAYGQQQQMRGQGQQQQFSYQPPASVTRKRGRAGAGSFSFSAGSTSSGTTSQEDRKFAFFSYLGFCFTGIAFFILKGKRQFVRFHAAQSVFLFGPAFAGMLILNILNGMLGWLPLIGGLFSFVFGTLTFIIAVPTVVLWLYLMFNAYRGATVKLPIVGDYAERFAGRGKPSSGA